MKRNLFISGAALIVMFSSCNDNNNGGGDNGGDNGNFVVTANITSNTTWTADKVYELGGRIAVEDGATLTIEPGTVIKGQVGEGASATALLIARGGKLMAEGTAAKPIIFTSVADEITPGQVAMGDVASPNLATDMNGLWGGVIVLGYAPISAKEGDNEAQIEGIPSSDLNGRYGGDKPEDNSGALKYISIRHGGTNIGAGNEINGLSLGGVGSGTVIENIEIVSNQDDAIEFFGGTVSLKNVVSWNVGDDGIDTDQSWAGTLDNFVVITPAGHCFELDGPEASHIDGHVIKNGVIVSAILEDDGTVVRISEDLINTDANSIVDLENLYFTGWKGSVTGGVGAEQKINRTIDNPDVSFTDIVINIPDGTTIEDHIADGTAPAGVTAGTAPAGTVDLSALSWTWAAQAGMLDGLY